LHCFVAQVSTHLLLKLQAARHLRAVVVASPSSVKSFMLKFIEICHNLNRQKHLRREITEKRAAEYAFSLRKLLGMGERRTDSSGSLTVEETQSMKEQAVLCVEIFKIMRTSVEIMDDVDIILHPLKSELNWPLGVKEPLDFTRSRSGNGLRWSIPSHLLDAIFSCCGMPILADIAESRQARK
jgi:hypothetical protein